MTNSQETPRFHYYTGEVVLAGDVVISVNGNPALVDTIIAPGTSDADAYACPIGGLLIKEYWDGVAGYLVIGPPDGLYWEDMQFVRRGDDHEGVT